MVAPLHPYTCACGTKICWFGGKGEPKEDTGSCLVAVNQPILHQTPILKVNEVFVPLHILWALKPVQVGDKFLQIWGQGWAQIMSWFHVWGCSPPHYALHILVECAESAWATSYAVGGHMGAPLHPYTCACGTKICKFGGKDEPKEDCGTCLVAVNHPTLHQTSILNVYEVFEPLHMLWMGIWL